MAGHNKWSKIKRQKGVEDAKRGAVFTKVIKQITTAAKQGGGDIDGNPALRVAVAKAKEVSMPQDNIKRAIDKATGNLDGVNYEEILYEAYGPNGVAIMIETMTDNRNRTVANIREILNKNGGSLGESGCVNWMFEKKGIITIQRGSLDDELMEVAMENGAEDIVEYDEALIFECSPTDFNSLLGEIDKLDVEILESNIDLIASNEIELGEDDALKIESLVEKLEDDDDVQSVFTNMK